MGELLPTFIVFFAVIDPVGTVPVFIAVTRQHSEREKRRIAMRATGIAAGILLFFVVAGEPILTAMQIPLEAFEIAGGIVLFLFAISMIFGESKPEEEVKLVREAGETAVFPLAVPSIAGPGAIPPRYRTRYKSPPPRNRRALRRSDHRCLTDAQGTSPGHGTTS